MNKNIFEHIETILDILNSKNENLKTEKDNERKFFEQSFYFEFSENILINFRILLDHGYTYRKCKENLLMIFKMINGESIFSIILKYDEENDYFSLIGFNDFSMENIDNNKFTEMPKIFEMKEGTMITLFYFKNRWIISTMKGLFINDMNFKTGNRDFDYDYESLVRESIQKSFEKNLDDFDKDYFYIANFGNEKIHRGFKETFFNVIEKKKIGELEKNNFDLKPEIKPYKTPINRSAWMT